MEEETLGRGGGRRKGRWEENAAVRSLFIPSPPLAAYVSAAFPVHVDDPGLTNRLSYFLGGGSAALPFPTIYQKKKNRNVIANLRADVRLSYGPPTPSPGSRAASYLLYIPIEKEHTPTANQRKDSAFLVRLHLVSHQQFSRQHRSTILIKLQA